MAVLPASGATVQAVALAPLREDQLAHRLSGEVFGYLPYWQIDSGTDAYLRYNLLSTIAFFSVSFTDAGGLNTDAWGYRTYMSSTATTIIEHAHAAGVRTVITFTSFGFAHNAAFFSDPTAQARFIDQALDLMDARGADGANVDVELIEGIYFDEYGAFLKAFREAARARNPIAQISVATNGNQSGAHMAAAAIANGVDRAFIMGYAYRSAGANPVGSISPLVRADGGLSLSTTLDLYAAHDVPMDRLLLGLPYYGLSWPTTSDGLHATRQANVSAYGGVGLFFPSQLPDAAEGAVIGYDSVEKSAWFARYDPEYETWRETYFDNPRSLGAKYALALRRGLAGAGIWALGYDRGQTGYWSRIARSFARPRILEVSITPNATKRLAVSVALSWRDGAHPTVEVQLSNDAKTWSDWRPVAATLSWTLADTGTDGARSVYVRVRDTAGAISLVAHARTTLDTHGPVLTSLHLWWSSIRHGWITTYEASDLTGVAAYEVRYRIGDGDWQLAAAATTRTRLFLDLPPRIELTVSVRARDTLGTWGSRLRLTRS